MRLGALSEPARLRGKVTHYRGNGRKLGYPTANIKATTNLPDGVYFGYADMASYLHHPAIVFIGTPTTIGDTGRRVEAHLLDVDDRDYYGEVLVLDFRHYHRLNETFDSVWELLDAMHADEATAREWFESARTNEES